MLRITNQTKRGTTVSCLLKIQVIPNTDNQVGQCQFGYKNDGKWMERILMHHITKLIKYNK